MDMFTTDVVPASARPVAVAWPVWTVSRSLSDGPAELEKDAAACRADAVVGLRIAVADDTYYIPYEPGIRSSGKPEGGTYWAVYGTAVRFQRTAAVAGARSPI